MRRRAQTVLAGLFTSGLLIAMATAATGAGAASGPGSERQRAAGEIAGHRARGSRA